MSEPRFACRIVVLASGAVLIVADPVAAPADPRMREVRLGRAGHG